MKHRFVRFALLLIAAFQFASSVAFAQAPAQVPEDEKGWMKWAIGAGLIVVVCLPAFINAKRSHLT